MGSMTKVVTAIAVVLLIGAGVYALSDDNKDKSIGETIEGAADDVGDALDDAVDDVKDAAEEASDEAKEAANEEEPEGSGDEPQEEEDPPA